MVKVNDHDREEKLKAAYALNMCNVSVSQIVDYNDLYILEQEYDAILNNLNLKQMPKDEALLKILTEILNTITFFRIQEIKKERIEEKYKQRIKNAIWSAIPNISFIVSGNPVTIAYSIATQVGIGYMNYRKEKASAFNDKKDSSIEIQIAALEQFNALRRELFTTAWRLADEYDFEDEWRLTEKQIKQYNQILMDQNELRKYIRLESIQDKFEAYPPFWYHFAHTASFIAGADYLDLDEWERQAYRAKAKQHFEQYYMLNKFNILREDQMTASFALEYADLLMLDDPDNEKIPRLIKTAEKFSGNALDIKELCAIAYLKIGDMQSAANIFKSLVNEDYNLITNAKLLSRIYVSQFLESRNDTAKFDYNNLVRVIGKECEDYLFPMPLARTADDKLLALYLVDQKTLLKINYRTALLEFQKKYSLQVNALVPAPYEIKSYQDYYDSTDKAMANRCADIERVLNSHSMRENFIRELALSGFRFKFIDLLNEALDAYDELSMWRDSEKHDEAVSTVKENVLQKKQTLKKLQDKLDAGRFELTDYKTMQAELGFRNITEELFDTINRCIMRSIDEMRSMEEVEKADYELNLFCQKHSVMYDVVSRSNSAAATEDNSYLDYDILGFDGATETVKRDKLNKIEQCIRNHMERIVDGRTNNVALLLCGTDSFDQYLKNKRLKAGKIREHLVAIIDDKGKENLDLAILDKGVCLIYKESIKPICSFKDVFYSKNAAGTEYLEMGNSYIGWPKKYSNRFVNIGELDRLLRELSDI